MALHEWSYSQTISKQSPLTGVHLCCTVLLPASNSVVVWHHPPPQHKHTILVLSSTPPQTKLRNISDRHSASSPQCTFSLSLRISLSQSFSLSIFLSVWVMHVSLSVRPGWHWHVRAADAEELGQICSTPQTRQCPRCPCLLPTVCPRPQFSLRCTIGV